MAAWGSGGLAGIFLDTADIIGHRPPNNGARLADPNRGSEFLNGSPFLAAQAAVCKCVRNRGPLAESRAQKYGLLATEFLADWPRLSQDIADIMGHRPPNNAPRLWGHNRG